MTYRSARGGISDCPCGDADCADDPYLHVRLTSEKRPRAAIRTAIILLSILNFYPASRSKGDNSPHMWDRPEPTFLISASDGPSSGLFVVNGQNLSGLQPKKQVFFLIFRLERASDPWGIQAPLPKSDKQRHLSSHLIRNTGR